MATRRCSSVARAATRRPNSSPSTSSAGQGGVVGGACPVFQRATAELCPPAAALRHGRDHEPPRGTTSGGAGGVGGSGSEAFPQMDYASEVNPWIETNKGRWFFSIPPPCPSAWSSSRHIAEPGPGWRRLNYSVRRRWASVMCTVGCRGLCVDATSGGKFHDHDRRERLEIHYSHTLRW